MTPLLNAAAGWLLFATLAVALGAVATRWVILAPAVDPHGVLQEGAARVGRGALAGVLVALGLVFLRQLLEFRDPFVPWTEDAHLLLTVTPWGRVWLLAVGGAATAAVALHLAVGGRGWGWWPATALTLALGAFPAGTGHANAAEPRALALLADTLHVWAMGGWIGGLFAVLALSRDRGRTGTDPLPDLVPRFSRLAQVCVALLAATGLFASWLHLDGWVYLVVTPYGRLLALKLCLVAVALALGAVNFRGWTPRLPDQEGRDGLRRTAAWELAMAGLVLLVTAALVHTSPR